MFQSYSHPQVHFTYTTLNKNNFSVHRLVKSYIESTTAATTTSITISSSSRLKFNLL
jgi:hypothetical protein